jgi:hypothetical protein
MSDEESLDDICSESYEESSDCSSEQFEELDQNTFEYMIIYINSIACEQIKPTNKIKREINLIKTGLNTKKKLADQKRNIKKIISDKKKLNKAKTRELNIELDEKIKQLNDTYETNKFRLDYLYALQKNTNIYNVKINRKEFFKICPDNLKPKIFITITKNFLKLKNNKNLKKIIEDEYLLDEIDKNLNDDCGDNINIFDEFDDFDMTISEIFNAMQKNAAGPDYMKFVMFVNMFEFNRFIKFVQRSIETNKKITDIETLIDELPEFLTGAAKENKLREMFKAVENFDMYHIAKFLTHNQTSGMYYQALIFLADYYNVEHKNCVPLFENLKTGDIKEEALGIYITLRAYQTDEFIVDNYNYMNYILQEPQQISWLSYKNSKKTDMTLPDIRINHEFNEKHHSGKKYKLNDAKKRSYAKIRGRYTIYFYFDTKAHDKQRGKRINMKSYLCDEYMEAYVNECRESAINSIVLNYDARDKFIFKLLKDSLVEQIASIDKTLVKYNDTEFSSTTEFKYKSETKNFKQSVLDDLNYTQIALDMFACKSMGYISFQKLSYLFGIEDKTKDYIKISELKMCLSRLNIIEKSDINEMDIKLTWKQLNQTIIKFDTKKENLNNILYEYWLELNESYENIVLRIQTFYENLVCNETDRNQIEELIKDQIGKFV